MLLISDLSGQKKNKKWFYSVVNVAWIINIINICELAIIIVF